ncbi:MAG: hypothetical protein ACREDL_01070 [Bradyrhizobium sp.]
MPEPIFTAETFAEHLHQYRWRVDQKRQAIEARPRFYPRYAVGATTDEGKQFWAGMRAAISRRQQPVDEGLARACERAEARLGREWLDSARHGESAALISFVEEGFAIDYSDPWTGETALHAAAGSQARPAVRLLLPHWPDFLMRDRRGRLASELAYLYGEDPAMARLLAIKERRQAVATGRAIGGQLSA